MGGSVPYLLRGDRHPHVVAFFPTSTTIKISNFQPGNISDDIFIFPEQLYTDYTFTEHRGNETGK